MPSGGFQGQVPFAGTSAGGAPFETGGAASLVTSVSWKTVVESADSSIFASTPSAASRGTEAAVAYVETTNAMPPSSRVLVQRFDASAERIGSSIVIGDDPDRQSEVTLASDGQRYAACWTSNLEVHCSLIDELGQAQRDVIAFSGENPTIVASPSGWVVAYAASDTRLVLQALSPTLEPSGDPVELSLSPQFRDLAPLFTPTPSGFALVGAGTDDGHDVLLRLGPDLLPSAAAISLGADFWFSGHLVASDSRAAVSLSAPYGAYLLLMDAAEISATLLASGGEKAGMDQALLLTEGGIGAAWLTGGDRVAQRFFADGRDGEIGLSTRGTPSSLGSMPDEGSESYQELLGVGDRVLLVGRASKRGPLAGDGAIRVAALTFP
jgi:hypothetical protein